MITLAILTDPVSIFFIVLVIILLAPVLLTKLHVPHIIGMIAAGVVVGPFGFDVLDRDSSFMIFGQVGLLYLMFLAGLEIDMYRLKQNFRKGALFGCLTFFIPLILGAVTSITILGLDAVPSFLLGSMYASHTLISYPITARLGLSKSPAVLIAVVGTIFAVVGSLLTLGAVVNIHQTGSFHLLGILGLLVRMAVYTTAVLYVYPRLTRWFFKNYSDSVTQFAYVLVMVFLSAWAASEIGLEAVLGAFFAGLVLNRYVPAGSSLMSRIEFVGNALFIPYFLIGVGMMINLHVLANADTVIVTIEILAVAIATKWIAAWITQKVSKMSADSRKLLFGLTTAHTAVALAVVTIGYNMVDSNGNHLLDETVMNGTILVILITCAIAPIVTSRAATRVKMDMINAADDPEENEIAKRLRVNNTLIPISNPVTAQSLVELALLMHPQTKDNGDPSGARLFALHVRTDNSSKSKIQGRESLELAVQAAAATDARVTPIERYDMNIITGVTNVIEERDITDVIIGMHRKTTLIDSFFGSVIDRLLKSSNKMVIISRFYIPVNTVTRIVVVVPRQAQFETGFVRWLTTLGNLARQIGCRIIFCCHESQQFVIDGVLRKERIGVRLEFRVLNDENDYVFLANKILDDDLLVVVSSRPTAISYSDVMTELPSFLQRYFSGNNLMIVYPEQFGDESMIDTFTDPLSTDITAAPAPLLAKLRGWIRRKFASTKKSDKIDL